MPDLYNMTDIETMDVTETAAILTIGSIMFDPRGNDTHETLRERSILVGPISLESNIREGRTMNPGTVMWWMQQSKAAQEGLYTGDQMNLKMALEKWRQWVIKSSPKPTQIWANSPSFDCSIIKNAMAALNMHWPFQYWAERDVRTIKALAWPEGNEPDFMGSGTAHDAVDDCVKQALLVQSGFRVLGV